MDNNVPKKANSHNFFKLRPKQEKTTISAKNFLKQELWLILDLYQQTSNISIEQGFVSKILETKIVLDPKQSSSRFCRHGDRRSHFSDAQFPPIVYAFPLGLALATSLQRSPQEIMEQLSNLLTLKLKSTEDIGRQTKHTEMDFTWEIITEIVTRGWINFYLNSQFIADWLKNSLCWSQGHNANEPRLMDKEVNSLEQTPAKLFAAQYIHSRCCSLLCLGARENLITLTADVQKIKQPQTISWLDPQQNLWFTEVTEHRLLQQLLLVSDFWLENTAHQSNDQASLHHWSKLAVNLSHNTAIFLADCRFLGEVKQQYPQKAIARLGLISLVQFWLEKILVEKLRVIAPREL